MKFKVDFTEQKKFFDLLCLNKDVSISFCKYLREKVKNFYVSQSKIYPYCDVQRLIGGMEPETEIKIVGVNPMILVTKLKDTSEEEFLEVIENLTQKVVGEFIKEEFNRVLVGAKRIAEARLPKSFKEFHSWYPGKVYLFNPDSCDRIRSLEVTELDTDFPEFHRTTPPPHVYKSHHLEKDQVLIIGEEEPLLEIIQDFEVLTNYELYPHVVDLNEEDEQDESKIKIFHNPKLGWTIFREYGVAATDFQLVTFLEETDES